MFRNICKWLCFIMLSIGALAPIKATQKEDTLNIKAKKKTQTKPRRSKKFSMGVPKTKETTRLEDNNRRNSVILKALKENRKQPDTNTSLLGNIEKSTLNLGDQINDTNNNILNMNKAYHENKEAQLRTEKSIYKAFKEVKKHKNLVAAFAFIAMCMVVLYTLSIRQVVKKADEIKTYGQETVQEATNYVKRKVKKAKGMVTASFVYLMLLCLLLGYSVLLFLHKKRKIKRKK